MKLGKTETILLKRASRYDRGEGLFSYFGISFGLEGVHRTRPYGERERLAALSLEKKGLAVRVNSYSSTYYTGTQGYFNPVCEVTYRLTAAGEALRITSRGA